MAALGLVVGKLTLSTRLGRQAGKVLAITIFQVSMAIEKLCTFLIPWKMNQLACIDFVASIKELSKCYVATHWYQDPPGTFKQHHSCYLVFIVVINTTIRYQNSNLPD